MKIKEPTFIRTRFPPEPNGFLHLGHFKSIYYNFNYPFNQTNNITKECYLRFDDTNPKSEKQEYVDMILTDLKWLGYQPDKISYTSDYFDIIIDLTKQLIKSGHAYCDPSSGSDIKQQRQLGIESKYRDTSIEENIIIFNNMIDGKYKEGDMTLRLKIPPTDRTNQCMIDPIAYRIIDVPHYRTNQKYHIYPSYEYRCMKIT